MRALLRLCGLIVALGLAGCTTHPPAAGSSSAPASRVPPSTTAAASGTATPTTPPPVGSGIGPVILEPGAGMTPIYDFLSGATTSLTMTMYELVDPTAERILGADAARGVRVRVLLDSALEDARNQPAQAYLASHGVIVALAPASRITHQKTICTDSKTCLVMSLNMVSADYASTRDVAVEDSDPSDVAAIETTFANDFAGGTTAAVGHGDHLLWSPGSEQGVVGVIDRARHTLEVENEEMASTPVTDALVAAARRGVDVEVCMTSDSSYTEALGAIARAGGHVHLYPDSRGSLYIHEKLVLADVGSASATALVGSINFSARSMDENRELDILLDEQDAPNQIAVLSAAFQSDYAGAPAR